MDNLYKAPNTETGKLESENNSGMNQDSFPDGVKGWSWGAFFLNWIWAVGNSVWIGLLALIPYVGLIMSIYLGIKGREMAWKARRWDSVEHFNEMQRKWSFWGVVVFVVGILIGVAYIFAMRGRY